MRRALFLTVLAALLLPACGNTDRPEGVVERWLISLNQGRAGEPENYAPDALSQRILPNWQNRDPGDLDVIEVGKGRVYADDRYDVPFRVERLNGSTVNGIAKLSILERWRVEELLPLDPTLPVPSMGGRRLGTASSSLWLAGLVAAGGLILLSVLLMSTVGREARVSK
jgi:hypothetical protein